MIEYNKLVRDRIPEIIRESGKIPTLRVLSDSEYNEQLDRKLLEEVNEYLESGELEELADITEVIRAILAQKGVAADDFEKACIKKREKRGAFEKRLLLTRVDSE